MNIKKVKGASLAQYAIIIALIALALVPVFYLLGINIVEYFSSLKQGLSEQKDSVAISSPASTPVSGTDTTAPEPIVSGSLSGSPDTPVKKCSDGVCTIDFGEYSLSGVPDNINDYLQSTGSSGTTETLLKLLDQIIAQSKSIKTSADISLLKDIASQGHDIADNQKEVEVRAKEMLKKPSDDISSGFFTDLEMLMLGSNVGLLDDKLKKLTGELKSSTDTNDQNILAIVTFLVNDIQSINKNLYDIGQSVKSGVNPPETYQAILTPQSSFLTDLDSAIICNTGNGTDTGTECK